MNLHKILNQISFFDHLSSNEKDLIIEKGIRKSIKKGETVHSPDEICYHMTIVLEGSLYSSKYSVSGNEQIVCNLVKGKCFGYPVVFGDNTYPEYIICESDAELLYISRETLLTLFENKLFLLDYLGMLGKKLKDFSNLVEILSFTSVRERVSKYLMGQFIQQNSNEIKIKNKTRLAKELGSVRGVISRVFKLLEEENIIEQLDNNIVKIIDINRLEFFS